MGNFAELFSILDNSYLKQDKSDKGIIYKGHFCSIFHDNTVKIELDLLKLINIV